MNDRSSACTVANFRGGLSCLDEIFFLLLSVSLLSSRLFPVERKTLFLVKSSFRTVGTDVPQACVPALTRPPSLLIPLLSELSLLKEAPPALVVHRGR